MSEGLPVGRGRLQWFSQRVDGRPFVNCMLYSLCTVLGWMGYELPLDDDGAMRYGMTLRNASGRPLYTDGTADGSKGGKAQGTNVADTKRALAKLLPSAPVVYGAISEADLIGMLPRPGHRNRHKAVVRISVRMIKLPLYMRRFVGFDWTGLHAATLAGQRVCNGEDGGDRHRYHINVQEVLFLDPFARAVDGEGQPYDGDWLPLDNLKPGLRLVPTPVGAETELFYPVTYGRRNTAVEEPV
jgi:hypothetical protein